ncbi:MAG TPA: radical SAM protein [Firmicutes bacterium]|nr:radical SAM protein [Bacillota bacterium]
MWTKLTREAWSLVAVSCGMNHRPHVTGPGTGQADGGCDGTSTEGEALVTAGDETFTTAGEAFGSLMSYLVQDGYLDGPAGAGPEEGVQARSPEAHAPPPIKRAYLNITDRCNLRCLTCYFNARSQAGEDDLPVDAWLEVVERIARDGITSVVISGGEPLIKAGIMGLLAKTASLFETVTLLTNGTMVTEGIAKDLVRLGIRIQVSLEGRDRSLHDMVRGPGSFNAAVTGIKRLTSAGSRHIELVPTITKKNLKGLTGFGDFAQSLGAGYHFSLFMPVGRGQCWSRDLEVTPADLATFVVSLMDRADGPRNTPPLDVCPRTSCGAGERIISLGPDATVYPCPLLHLPGLASGNALKESLGVIMGRMMGLIPGVDDLPGCSECDVRYFCGGGCRAASYQDRGDFVARDPYCEFYRRLYRAFVWEWRDDRALEDNLALVRRCLLEGAS